MQNKYSNKKIVWFPDKLQSFREGKITAPIYVRIKPTNMCNAKCWFCSYRSEVSDMHKGVNKIDQLSKKKLLEILIDLHKIGTKAITYSGGGEPLTHPDITDVLRITKDLKFDYSIITNGSLLSGKIAEELADAKWVRISMDYYDGESMQKTRGIPAINYARIINNIEEFSKIKKDTCDLSVNFVITHENYSYIPEVCEILEQAGIEIIRFSPVWVKDFIEYHAPIQENVNKLITDAMLYQQTDKFRVYSSYNIAPQLRTYTKCYFNQIVPVIAANEKVYTCHNMSYSKEAEIGDISNKTFKELWFSKETKEFFNNFEPQKICNHQCANDSKNIFINDLLDCYGDNFV